MLPLRQAGPRAHWSRHPEPQVKQLQEFAAELIRDLPSDVQHSLPVRRVIRASQPDFVNSPRPAATGGSGHTLCHFLSSSRQMRTELEHVPRQVWSGLRLSCVEK